ncbi:hypothetical protein SAMN05421678_114125 [Actinopolymorpha cephalotaxi]|uniref:Uncharacterized protein n=1 Tax=Actinopolymorpha cephalotaxi TaxID=504797 RepID=A0A1I2YJ58_9ACTN|nr:hypothetical protein [Actinopolymorpha cephalotaxi]NYH86941.1 hypothetical protein [Actinopolymorpha cephalotaxi]SFH25674.1 hypothetical protein SAMN05421678_114125 [Actinopolymorpha cephalotaxi]
MTDSPSATAGPAPRSLPRGGRRPAWALLAAFVFADAYAMLRLLWATGSRWGYTACDRTVEHTAGQAVTGCGASGVEVLPFWSGWGAVALCAVLVAVTALGVARPGRVVAAGLWGCAAVLVALSFPGHLVFEFAAAAGHPTDWRDLANRVVLLAGGLLVAAAAVAAVPRAQGVRRPAGVRPAPRWLRAWAYAGCALPLLGWTMPHTLWLLGVPLGIPARMLAEVREDINVPMGLALCGLPALGGLLTLGLAARWGQEFPRWVPLVGRRRVPRLLALVPAGVVSVALTSYGVIGLSMIATALVDGQTTWAGLASAWAVTGTEVLFLAWGVALGVATLGYHRLARAR